MIQEKYSQTSQIAHDLVRRQKYYIVLRKIQLDKVAHLGQVGNVLESTKTVTLKKTNFQVLAKGQHLEASLKALVSKRNDLHVC